MLAVQRLKVFPSTTESLIRAAENSESWDTPLFHFMTTRENEGDLMAPPLTDYQFSLISPRSADVRHHRGTKLI